MEISRRSFLRRTSTLAALGAWEASRGMVTTNAAPAEAGRGSFVTLPPVTLRGYGTLSATYQTVDGDQASRTRIRCESHAKALLVQAKYLSDLERLPGIVADRLTVGGRAIPFGRSATGGAVACYAAGRDVVLLAGVDRAALQRVCEATIPATATADDFTQRVSVPMYLDRWDRYGLLFYFSPDATPPGVTDPAHAFDRNEGLAFVQKHGTGLILWSNPLIDDTAEGLTNEQAWAWVQEGARARGVPLHINTQISPPQLWLSNRYREQTMLKTPQFLGGYYGVAHDSAGVGAISWHSEEAEDALLGVFQSTVRRFAGEPNLVGWLEPHGETAESPQTYFLESGPYADEALRGFLRRRYGTLRAVSERWHGASDYYGRWSDVRLPEIAELAGFGPEAIDLRGVWRVRYVPAPDGHTYTRDEARGLPSPPPTAPVPPEWFQPGFDDNAWDEILAPGNDRMLAMPRSPLVYRRTVSVAAEWLTAHPHVTLVVWDMVNREADRTVVVVNGHTAPERSYQSNERHWSEFDVTGFLRAGDNLLAIQMPRGIVCYRMYLTGETVRQYPYLGPGRNAQWADLVAWNTESRGAQIRRGAEMIRQVDSDRSINFMAADDYADSIKKACRDYGGRFHDTGAMAGFWTEWNTLMMSGAGLPTTAEPGNGAPNPREFQLFWGRWLTEGVNGVHYFQNWGEVAWNPEVLKIFEANLPLYQSVGKYHAPFAKVGVLFSGQNARLTGFPWTPESGMEGGYYSPYNAATALIDYCPRDGVGAADFETDAVDRYPVIVDTNTAFMEDSLVDGIERYVRRGGVFITNGQTGQHTPVEPDRWPICRLTGYRVVGTYGWGDGKTLTPAPQSALADSPPIRSLGLRLAKTEMDTTDLLLWDDGTPAAGFRRLGKGWIVHFGPTVGGETYVAMTAALLRHFGVNDRVPARVAPRRGLHFRHFIGNTGLHDVWVLFNESDAALTTDLTFLPTAHPASLTDIVTGEQPALVRDPMGDSIPGITLAPWQTRMYLSPRPEVVSAPLEWLTLQRNWWQGTVPPPRRHLPTPTEQQRFTLDLTDDWAFRVADSLTDEQAAALALPNADDTQWERRRLNTWLVPNDGARRRLILRRRFTVPAHWTNGVIRLCADVPILQFYGDTRLFLNGTAWGRPSIDGPYDAERDGQLKPGATCLLALDIQSHASLIGSRGPIWLTYLPEPQDREDLAGSWTAYSDPLHATGIVPLPGDARAMYLTRSVTIDRKHEGRNVVVYLEATGDHLSLLVNGRLLNVAEQVRAHSFSFCVTPMIRFGESNQIEIAGSGAGDKSIHRVEIRYYDKGVYP